MYDSEEEKYYKNLNRQQEKEGEDKFFAGIWSLIVLSFYLIIGAAGLWLLALALLFLGSIFPFVAGATGSYSGFKIAKKITLSEDSLNYENNNDLTKKNIYIYSALIVGLGIVFALVGSWAQINYFPDTDQALTELLEVTKELFESFKE